MSSYFFVLKVFLRMISVRFKKIVPENFFCWPPSIPLLPPYCQQLNSLLFLYYQNALCIYPVEYSCHCALPYKQIFLAFLLY